jgi:CBS domain-containing protein
VNVTLPPDASVATAHETMLRSKVSGIPIVKDGGSWYFDTPRGGAKGHLAVFNLDTLEPVGDIDKVSAGGATVDPKSHHGFSTTKPITMWDSNSLTVVKTIDVDGRPDGILLDPYNERVWVLSHQPPYATVIDARAGTVVGTLDLGGAPEQAASDGQGHLYVDIEDKDNVAVVDVKTLNVTAHYELAGKGGTPAGLALDAKNHILFAMCRSPATCVVLNADDGKILTALPIGNGTDGGGFNPNTMEAFSSQGDGTLTIIKENSPTSFEVEQTVQTKPRAKTCTLDTKNNQIVLIATEPAPAPPPAADAATSAPHLVPRTPGCSTPARSINQAIASIASSRIVSKVRSAASPSLGPVPR